MSENIKVIIRIRKLASNFENEFGYSIENSKLLNFSNKQYTFDYIADKEEVQEKFYEKVGKIFLNNCLGGYNGTIFCYGQTNAGKTYTMFGEENNEGIVPRLIKDIFFEINKSNQNQPQNDLNISNLISLNTSYKIFCSFFEIYNENVFDLLGTDSIEEKKYIREDINNNFYVENLTEKEISSEEEAFNQLKIGMSRRKIASTAKNKDSSRSHTIFTILIKKKIKQKNSINLNNLNSNLLEQDNDTYLCSEIKLNLVDLAGSEKYNAINNLKETISINKSLFHLTSIIQDLSSMNETNNNIKNKYKVISYRDSVITKLLKDSLGGNSKTYVISNISSSNTCYSESISTLEFASKAKNIKNKPIINENTIGSVQGLQKEIKKLKEQINILKNSKKNIEEEEKIKREFEDLIKNIENEKNENFLLNENIEFFKRLFLRTNFFLKLKEGNTKKKIDLNDENENNDDSKNEENEENLRKMNEKKEKGILEKNFKKNKNTLIEEEHEKQMVEKIFSEGNPKFDLISKIIFSNDFNSAIINSTMENLNLREQIELINENLKKNYPKINLKEILNNSFDSKIDNLFFNKYKNILDQQLIEKKRYTLKNELNLENNENKKRKIDLKNDNMNVKKKKIEKKEVKDEKEIDKIPKNGENEEITEKEEIIEKEENLFNDSISEIFNEKDNLIKEQFDQLTNEKNEFENKIFELKKDREKIIKDNENTKLILKSSLNEIKNLEEKTIKLEKEKEELEKKIQFLNDEKEKFKKIDEEKEENLRDIENEDKDKILILEEQIKNLVENNTELSIYRNKLEIIEKQYFELIEKFNILLERKKLKENQIIFDNKENLNLIIQKENQIQIQDEKKILSPKKYNK